MPSADVLEFNDISSEVRGGLCRGQLKLTKQDIIFKNSKTGKVDQISVDDVDLANWLKLVHQFAIRLFLKNGALYRLIGFKDSEREKIAKFFKTNYHLDVLEKELSLKGWNWGTVKFVGSVLSFEVNNETAFEIPLNNVFESLTAKNEVTLKFHQNNEAPVSLFKMSYHIPSSELAGDDPVDAFHQQVMKHADVINVCHDNISSNAIAIFREVYILTPRGRYDIKILSESFQLHGKTNGYYVPMSTIVRLFLLPHKDGRQYFLVISLDPPITQGQTRYHFLVLQFNQDETVSMDLPLDEETIKTKYKGKITKELSGPTYEVLAKIMTVLSETKITPPGSFVGHSGTAAISCSFKAEAGYIYPLDCAFIYINKPSVHIRFEEIQCVNFARGGGPTRSFDFEVELKNGTVYTFSSIEKEEYGKLYDFVNAKGLRIKNRGNTDTSYTGEDFEDSDQEIAPDAYLEQVKREGKKKNNDDDESTDEDFELPAGYESEVDDKYDSNAAISSSESGESSDTEKKDKKKNKEKKNVSSESGESSDTEKKDKKKNKEKKSVKQHNKKPKETSSKPKKKQKEKDANKPKRPPSAYMLWFNETRDQIKADNPGISFANIGKRGGELWKKLSSSDKKSFESRAKVGKENYTKAMKEYEANGRTSTQGTSSTTTKKSSTNTSSISTSKADGSGSNYVSKEFVESDSSSCGSDREKPKKKSKRDESLNEDNDDGKLTRKKREASESPSDERRKPQSKKKKRGSETSEEEDSASSDTSE